MVLGAILIAYPYMVSDTIALFVIGALLTAGLFIFRAD